ncbi:MAG: hypothetical protein E7346_04340 [Clostridiales bacterium]|nr:hypothetical protein [Clostridiales bacterium]
MCVVLKPDIIVAAMIKRINNFYQFMMTSRKISKDKIISHKEYEGFSFSLEDCVKMQNDSRNSSLGIVIANTEKMEFQSFLENKSMFKPIGVDLYRLTEEAEEACFANQVDDLMDAILENAYSRKILLAMGII